MLLLHRSRSALGDKTARIESMRRPDGYENASRFERLVFQFIVPRTVHREDNGWGNGRLVEVAYFQRGIWKCWWTVWDSKGKKLEVRDGRDEASSKHPSMK